METNNIAPFVEGIEEFVSTMLHSSCSVAVDNAATAADVSSVISLHGERSYQIVLSFPRSTAERVVAELLSMDQTDVDDSLLGDGIGEVANIIVGSAKRRLSSENRPLQISLPQVIVSAGHDLTLFHTANVVHIRMSTELGDFSLRVASPTQH